MALRMATALLLLDVLAVKCCADIHSAQKLIPTDLGNPLTFHLMPLSRQGLDLKYLNVYNMVWHKILHIKFKTQLFSNTMLYSPLQCFLGCLAFIRTVSLYTTIH